jgi:hypothetical protein
MGFEPATFRTIAECLNQLRYRAHNNNNNNNLCILKRDIKNHLCFQRYLCELAEREREREGERGRERESEFDFIRVFPSCLPILKTGRHLFEIASAGPFDGL